MRTMRSASRVTQVPPRPAAVPRLENGDRLTAEEFERRYDAMPELKKAELIEGVVYVPSPVSIDAHAEQHFDLVGCLWLYRSQTPGVQGGDNATLRLPRGMNRPQPDACLRIMPELGGQSSTSEDGYILGSPEFVGEVSASSVSYDLHEKLDAYRRNGVREYLVWRVEDAAIDSFSLHGEKYRPMAARGGVIKSKVLPGLWLMVDALVRGDVAKVREVLEQGLASPEHARFVARLAKRRAARDR